MSREVKSVKSIAACIGYFDGVHRGHQELIRATKEYANENNLSSAIITFHPDPLDVLTNKSNDHLTPVSRRIQYFREYGIDQIIFIEFNPRVCALTPEQFHQQVIQFLNIKCLVCGYDFTFGKGGKGNAETLKAFKDIHTIVIDPVLDEGIKISSTRIKEEVKAGNLENAVRLLGHDYSVQGIVSHGREVGRTIGFPTANIKLDYQYVLPRNGVYAGRVEINENRYPAMINLGHNSKFNHYHELSFEVHVIDFDEDIYDEKVNVYFDHFIRDEIKFSNKEQLQKQLQMDKMLIRKIYHSGE